MSNPELNHEVENQLSEEYRARREFELDQELKQARQEIDAGRRWFLLVGAPLASMGLLTLGLSANKMVDINNFLDSIDCPDQNDIEMARQDVDTAFDTSRAEGINEEELAIIDGYREKLSRQETLFEDCARREEDKNKAQGGVNVGLWMFGLGAWFSSGYVTNKFKEWRVTKELSLLQNQTTEDSTFSQIE